MPKKRAIISVINDLVTDQRVDKSARVLVDLGFEVTLVGREKRDSIPLPERNYEMHRMRLIFEKGFLFYAEYNLRLFFYLLGSRTDLLLSNDLDTLLPNFLAGGLKSAKLVFDSHEYFTETPEVIHRPFVKSTWKHIEKWIVPHLRDCITVNRSIAHLFKQEYGVDFKVVRNIPPTRTISYLPSRKELGLPEDKKIVILQGAGINIQRGAEEAVEAMQFVTDALLLIVGNGDVVLLLKTRVNQLKLNDQVLFIPKQTPEKLFAYTANADLGLSLDKDTNLNYRFSLPNKLFDYIHAGIPVLVSPLVEVKRIVEEYQIGDCIENHSPQHIAEKITGMLENETKRKIWEAGLTKAKQELTWEKEKQVLVEIFSKYA